MMTAHRWTLAAVAVVAGALVAYGFDARWFEDDAMISMLYARNVAGGCGWSFNCGADDFATTSFLHRVRRSWIVPGGRFRAAGAPETKASGDGHLAIEMKPAKPPAVTLAARLDDAALSDGTFPASDLVLHLIHDTPPAPLRQVTVMLESESASGPGHTLLRMNRGFLPERRQHTVLSQENVVADSNFNPGRVVRVQLDYAFADPPTASGRLSVERLEIISFAGCRLAGDCASRIWR